MFARLLLSSRIRSDECGESDHTSRGRATQQRGMRTHIKHSSRHGMTHAKQAAAWPHVHFARMYVCCVLYRVVVHVIHPSHVMHVHTPISGHPPTGHHHATNSCNTTCSTLMQHRILTFMRGIMYGCHIVRAIYGMSCITFIPQCAMYASHGAGACHCTPPHHMSCSVV